MHIFVYCFHRNHAQLFYCPSNQTTSIARIFLQFSLVFYSVRCRFRFASVVRCAMVRLFHVEKVNSRLSLRVRVTSLEFIEAQSMPLPPRRRRRRSKRKYIVDRRLSAIFPLHGRHSRVLFADKTTSLSIDHNKNNERKSMKEVQNCTVFEHPATSKTAQTTTNGFP